MRRLQYLKPLYGKKAADVRLTQTEIDILSFDINRRFARSVRSDAQGFYSISEANLLGYGFNLISGQPTRNRCILNRQYQTIDNFNRYLDGRIVSSKSEVDEFFLLRFL